MQSASTFCRQSSARVGGDEIEVAPRLHAGEVVRHGRGLRIAGVDGMGGGDDEALALLAVDDGEARDRDGRAVALAGGDEVLEHVAGADARAAGRCRRRAADARATARPRKARRRGARRASRPRPRSGNRSRAGSIR